MSSAICFNLDQSKILSYGNGLSHWLIDKEFVSIIFLIGSILSKKNPVMSQWTIANSWREYWLSRDQRRTIQCIDTYHGIALANRDIGW